MLARGPVVLPASGPLAWAHRLYPDPGRCEESLLGASYRVLRREAGIHPEIEPLGHGHNRRDRGDTQLKDQLGVPWHVDGCGSVLAHAAVWCLRPQPVSSVHNRGVWWVSSHLACGATALRTHQRASSGLTFRARTPGRSDHHPSGRYVPLPSREGPPDHSHRRHACASRAERACMP